jgi:hypothetical protein
VVIVALIKTRIFISICVLLALLTIPVFPVSVTAADEPPFELGDFIYSRENLIPRLKQS